MIALFLVWATHGGGYDLTVWAPSVFFVLSLILISALAYQGALAAVPRRVLLAIGAFAAFTGWCFLSITWSDNRGIAWDGANRTALYLAIFVAFALLPWSGRSAAALLAVYSAAVAVIVVAEVWRAVIFPDLGRFFDGGRFTEPIGYSNGAAAFFLLAFWPAVLLSTRSEVPRLVRAALFACAGMLAEVAVLSQSRGSLFAMCATVAVFLLLVPRRRVALLALIAIGLAVLAAVGPLLDVYRVIVAGGDSHGALRKAAIAIAVSGVVLFAVGLIGAYADLRFVDGRLRRRVALAATGATVLVLLVGGAVFLHHFGNPAHRVANAWNSFTSVRSPLGTKPDPKSHFAAEAGNGNRYDFWRVAWNEFEAHPLRGVGVDNFALDYLVQRRSLEEPLYPFSVELRVLSQTGIIGAFFFVLFIGAALAAAWKPRSPMSRATAAAAAAMFGYWLAQGAAEWLWEIPAIAGPALAALAILARLGSGSRSSVPTTGPMVWRILRVGVVALAVAAGIAVAGSATFPWLSALKIQSATHVWRQQPQVAYTHLSRAADLNSLSDNAYLVAGAIAARKRDWPQARKYFHLALDRNPRNWYPYLELGLIDAYTGHGSTARKELAMVRRLNPKERLTDYVAGRLRIKVPVAPGVINTLLRQRVQAVTAATPATVP
jgi:hypothetical protein